MHHKKSSTCVGGREVAQRKSNPKFLRLKSRMVASSAQYLHISPAPSCKALNIPRDSADLLERESALSHVPNFF